MPILGYWKLRGLGQHIRFLLAYTEEPNVEEKIYEMGDAPDYDRSSWLNEKFTLGLDFPNLPYYIDGDLKLTESNAIARYIARKHGLVGKTEAEKVGVDMMESLTYGLHIEVARVCYGPDFETNRKNLVAGLKDKLKPFSDYLGNKKFFVSDEITLGDFHMYEVLAILKGFAPEQVAEFPNLLDFMKRFEDIPQIKAYMASDKYIKAPFMAKMANWGGSA